LAIDQGALGFGVSESQLQAAYADVNGRILFEAIIWPGLKHDRCAYLQATASKDVPQTVEGAMTEVLMASMKAKISEALQTENVSVRDMRGDGRHVEIDVVSKLFEGQSTMQRQRMVYKSIWLELQDSVHAVDAMTTKTPSEAGL
jgi:stress-induced morphogen